MRTARLIAVFLALAALAGCKNDVAAPGPPLPPRTFRMGFSAIPPRADINVLIASINLWALRSDAGILSYELPWDSLLAGVPPERIVVRDLLGLAGYFRAKGLDVWVYIDPANGLNRGGEADGLIRYGRSITEPSIQQMYRRWVILVDSIVRPGHLGLALETNLIRGASPPSLYAAIRQAVNDAAADVRARDDSVKLSVSVQVDFAWGRFDSSGYHGVDTDFVHFPFIQELGLSSYPYLAGYTEPEELPLDYYARLLGGRSMPAMVTEGGWTSVSLGGIISSREKQRRYLVRQMQILDSVRATALFQLTFTDLDLSGVTLPPGSILPLFAHLGLVDSGLGPKPALGVWDTTFMRPRQ